MVFGNPGVVKTRTVRQALSGVAFAVMALKANPDFTTEAQRVRAFVKSGAGCRATYLDHAKKLEPVERPARIVLARTNPPAEAVLASACSGNGTATSVTARLLDRR